MGTSNWDKFLLLSWKNWKLQWTKKKSTFFEILIPILLSSLLILIRYIVDPIVVTEPILFKEEPINLDLLRLHMNNFTASPVSKWELAYSPKNDLLDKIIKMASTDLKLTSEIVGLSNSNDLESYMSQEFQSLVGIQFDNNLAGMTEYPKHLSYKLRFPSELRMYPLESSQLWKTQYLYPLFDFGGPRNQYYNDGGEPGYIREGFIAVQHAVSSNIIKVLAESESKTIDLPDIKMQRTPYPAYTKDIFLEAVEAFIPLIIVISYVHLASETVRYVTNEKEKQLKEAMKIMGLPNWLHWLSWFTKTFLLMAISITVIVILLKQKWNGSYDVAVFTYADWSCLLLFLYVYCIAAITYCFMITTFFAKARTASAVNGLVWFMFYMPYALTNANYKTLNLSEKLGLCLFHNTAMGYGFKLILQYEGTGEGLHWNNLFRSVNVDDDLSVGLIIIMLLVSSLLYMIVTLYVEKIFPGDFGVPEKWNFPFKKDYWVKKSIPYNEIDNNESNNNNNNNDINSSNVFEHHRSTMNYKNNEIGVAMKNLNKTFGDKQAVKDLSLNLYENEITVLLGHNGAGKTTTISMLTGMIPPTSGTAIINGSDIRTNLMGVRMSLGLCPQHNILFDELTVREHIIFYSRVKGVSGNDNINNEVNKYIKILELEDKLNTPSKQLSGGMKRKLSVICALCGNTKVVFLDEPSSGMDPAARRTLWDILHAEKKGRTILLSTHYMDEADAVGDRIAIMAASQLKGYGTSFSLKKQYGSGYHLICVKKDDCDPENVTQLLRQYIPDIEIDKNIGTELSYKLPDSYSTVFEDMLSELETRQDELQLDGYGISITSLEEVFMAVGSEKHDDNLDVKNMNYKKNICDIDYISATKQSALKMYLSQWRAMLLKKYLYSKRNYILFLIQNIIVIFLLIVTIFVQKASERTNTLPPLLITLKSYDNTMNVIETSANSDPFETKISGEYQKYLKSLGSEHKVIPITKSFTDYLLEQNEVDIKTKYLIAATILSNSIIAWFNNQLLHTAPLSLNIVHNAILRTILPDHNIDVTNYPLPKSIKTQQAEAATGSGFGFQLALNLCIGLSFATGFYVMFIIKERQSRAKLLQFVSGVRVTIFWLSHLLFDYITFIVIAIVALIILVSFQQDGYTTVSEIGRIFLVILLFGLAIIPFIYVLSILFNDPVTGYSYTSLFNVICVTLYIIVFVMRFLGKEELSVTLNYIFLMFPMYALATALNNLSSISSMEETCIKQCKYYSVPSEFCKMDILCKIDKKCCLTDYFDFKYPGIGWNLIYMIFTCLICLLILLIISHRFIKELFHKVQMKIMPPSIAHTFENSDIDDDVRAEKNRIANMSTDEIKSNNLVLIDATKYYSKFLAVNQISVGIRPAECFGLLGINGAGKTTLFKMMTGDEIITYGEAYVKGKSLRNEMNDVYRDIGYCPQFDALLEDLTGREILRIFSLLRGIKENRINDIANQLALLFGYAKHIDKPCKTYSGGNKRKLSTSIAILGCPSVIYLDEPTSGMDPGARRQLWNVVNQIRTTGKAIILTSHSMEECEALCTRLAIMVNGEFKCIGSTQHLKNKFAKGLILKIKVKRDELDNNEIYYESNNDDNNTTNIDKIKSFIQNEFPDAVLQEEYQEMLTFNIPLSSIKWSKIFGIIESNKDNLNIEDYSISQTTLEQIFLGFAQHQREDTRLSK